MNLAAKVALVTGGCSGIGRAIAIGLLQAGAEVHIADLNPEVACDCAEFDSDNAQQLKLDVSDAEAVQAAVEGIVDEAGRIDILVNCAGILKTKPLAESTMRDWDDVCRVNLSGVYYCSRAVLPAMVRQRAGKIVNIASVSAAKGGGQFGNVLYGTTKAGVIAFTQGFARELGPYGINVNAISPGVVDTAMTSNVMTDEVRATIVESMPLRRLVGADEIARMALFLASDLASGITGQAIPVDAGFLIR